MDQPRFAPRRLALALAAAALLGGAAAGPAAADDLQVVASIKPVHSLVSAVMAGVGEPHLMIRGHASPHTFSMRPSDAEALEDADIVFLIGDMMETTLAGPVESLAGDARVVRLADTPGLVLRSMRAGGAFEEHGHEGEDDHGHGHMHGGHGGVMTSPAPTTCTSGSTRSTDGPWRARSPAPWPRSTRPTPPLTRPTPTACCSAWSA